MFKGYPIRHVHMLIDGILNSLQTPLVELPLDLVNFDDIIL